MEKDGNVRERKGSGAKSDYDISMANDPWSIAWGECIRTKRQQQKYAERERKRMRRRIDDLLKKLGVNITMLDLDFNIFSSVLGKRGENVIDWIKSGRMTYVGKEKALAFLSYQSAPIAATAAKAGLEASWLSSAKSNSQAIAIQDFVVSQS